MPRVLGLGHVGIFVQDLERMVAHYRDFLGMTVTKQDWERGTVFLSAEPQAADHEIALVRGRPSPEDPQLIHQISMRVASLDDVRQFYHRALAEGYRIQRIVSHASAVGCYFYDPEGNINETFWLTGLPCWVVTAEPLDLDQDDATILAQVHAHWERLRDVPVGGRLDPVVP